MQGPVYQQPQPMQMQQGQQSPRPGGGGPPGGYLQRSNSLVHPQQWQQQQQMQQGQGGQMMMGMGGGMGGGMPLGPQQQQGNTNGAELERLLQSNVSKRMQLQHQGQHRGGPGAPMQKQGSRYSVDSDLSDISDEINMDALASKDGFLEYVSTGSGAAGSPVPGQQPRQGGRMVPGPATARGAAMDDDDDEFFGRKKPTTNTTGSLAEFLRTTGPAEDPMTPPASPQQQKKKRNTGIFGFGSGKKKEREQLLKQQQQQQQQQAQQRLQGSNSPKPRHVPLPVSNPPGPLTPTSPSSYRGGPSPQSPSIHQQQSSPQNIQYQQHMHMQQQGVMSNMAPRNPPQQQQQQQMPQQQQQQQYQRRREENGYDDEEDPRLQQQQQGMPMGSMGMLGAPPSGHQRQQMVMTPQGPMPASQYNQMIQQQQQRAYPNHQQLTQQQQMVFQQQQQQQYYQMMQQQQAQQQLQQQQPEQYDDDDEYSDDDIPDDDTDADYMDDDVRENTRYNAMLDLDFLDSITGGDHDAPMPRVQHGRAVIFNQTVDQISSIRILNEDDDGADYDEEDPDAPDPQIYEIVSTSTLKQPAEHAPAVIHQRGSSLMFNPANPPTPLNPNVSSTASDAAADDEPEAAITAEDVVALRPPVAPRPPSQHPNAIPEQQLNDLRNAVPTMQPTSIPDISDLAQFAPAMATQTSDDAPTPADAAILAVDPFTAAAAMPAPAPVGQSRPRRKVRHVQIQTRSATLKDQTTQCDSAPEGEAPPPVVTASVAASSGAAAGGDELARLRAELAESNRHRQSAESALASLRASSAASISRAESEAREAREALDHERRKGPDPELVRLKEEVASLTLERDALGARVGEMVIQATERESVMEGEKDKFERLSSQAFRKIKELLTERRVVEVEVEGLRAQLEALEEHQKRWVADTDDEDEGDAKDDAK